MQLSRLYNQEPGDISSINKIEADIDQIIDYINTGIDNDNIKDSAIITSKLADLAVTTAKIANTAITEGKLADVSVTTAKLADNAVIDSKIGNRTVDQAITDVMANTGTLTQLLSWIVKQLMLIIDNFDWKNNPQVNLASVKTHIDADKPHSGHLTSDHYASTSTDHDNRYYTEAEVNNLLSAKADADNVVNSIEGIKGVVDLVEGTGIQINSDAQTGVITITATTEAVPGPHMHNDTDINLASTPDTLIATDLSRALDELADLFDEVVDTNSKDANGIYTIVNYKRKDGTLYLKSTLSNPDVNGNYQTDTWEIYASDGVTLAKTIIWTLSYDADGNIISKSGEVS